MTDCSDTSIDNSTHGITDSAPEFMTQELTDNAAAVAVRPCLVKSCKVCSMVKRREFSWTLVLPGRNVRPHRLYLTSFTTKHTSVPVIGGYVVFVSHGDQQTAATVGIRLSAADAIK